MPVKLPFPGAIVDGKYRLADRIGGGGMGDVFLAENVLAGRRVAIKFLHPELAENVEIAQRFFQEARAVNRIKHPNIVDVIEAGQSESGPYLVMEHLDGESVGAVLARIGRFDVEGAVATMIPVLEALEAAHRVDVIHRDLKPENVFIALDGTARERSERRGDEGAEGPASAACVVRLLDFGVAKILSPNTPTPKTHTGVVFGTPDYLSPEQATGDAPLDGRSDLFAVGVLLFEMLTGVRPFRAATAVATAFRVVHSDAPTMASVGVHVDPRLERIVQKLLMKDPARRHQTAMEVIHDLETIVPDPACRAAALARLIDAERRLARRIAGMVTPSVRPPSVNAPAPSPRPAPSAVRAEVSSQPPVSSAPSPVAPTGLAPTLPASTLPPVPHRPYAEHGGVLLSAHDSSSPSWPAPRGAGEGERPSGIPVRRSSVRPQIRPLPAKYAGRFQVRGIVLRAVDRVVTDVHGRPVRDEIVAGMPAPHGADFANDSIDSMVSYELEALDAYMELATAIAVGDPTAWRALGRRSVRGELAGITKSIARATGDPAAALLRSIQVWSRLFSFGSCRVDRSLSGRLALSLADLDPASLPLRLWIVGVLDETVQRTLGPDARVTITLGEIGFTPELACEVG